MDAASVGVVAWLSSLFGVAEPVFRLFVAVLAGYPVAILHRRFVRHWPAVCQHVFFVLCGFYIAYFNYGWYALHHVVCVVALHWTLRVLGGSVAAVVVAFVFQLGYLVIGFICFQTKDYDITWCTSHCVLTLKMIGVAFDLYDGHKPKSELRPDEKQSALVVCPSLLQLCAHGLFPCTLVVGPQFPLALYLDFTCHALDVPLNEAGLPDSVSWALDRLKYGLIYTVFYVIMLTFVVPNNYFTSTHFLESGLVGKMFWITVWHRASFARYVIVWLLAEGGCALIGLTYNGRDAKSRPRWDRLCNIDIALYESASRVQDYISCFNINTNHWASKYVFKRLIFLGNKNLSQLLTLLFLAVWHGYHLGYFVVFFTEFLVVLWERKMGAAISQYPSALIWLQSGWRRLPCRITRICYSQVMFAYCSIPFLAVSRHSWWPLYRCVYVFGHVLFVSWPLLVPAIHVLMATLHVPRVRQSGRELDKKQS